MNNGTFTVGEAADVLVGVLSLNTTVLGMLAHSCAKHAEACDRLDDEERRDYWRARQQAFENLERTLRNTDALS